MGVLKKKSMQAEGSTARTIRQGVGGGAGGGNRGDGEKSGWIESKQGSEKEDLGVKLRRK